MICWALGIKRAIKVTEEEAQALLIDATEQPIRKARVLPDTERETRLTPGRQVDTRLTVHWLLSEDSLAGASSADILKHPLPKKYQNQPRR